MVLIINISRWGRKIFCCSLKKMLISIFYISISILMKNYKKILEKFFADNLSEDEFNNFQHEIASRISKVLSYYKSFLSTSTININSYIEDIIQEIFLAISHNVEKVYNQHKDVNDETFDKIFTCWLNTTINNVVKNFTKGKKVISKVTLSSVFIDSQCKEDDSASEIILVDDTELVDINLVMEDCLSKLTDEEKEIINLRIAGKTQKEIAKILSKSEATISRAIKTIIDKLKKMLM